jgi:hypothetical protein
MAYSGACLRVPFCVPHQLIGPTNRELLEKRKKRKFKTPWKLNWVMEYTK